MPLQTEITEFMGSAYPGMPYDLSSLDPISRNVEGPGMPFGIAALYGTHNGQCRSPDHGDALGVEAGATSDETNRFAGIVLYHAPNARYAGGSGLMMPLGDGSFGFLTETETASLATQGRVYVRAKSNVSQGDPVYYRHTLTDPAAAVQTETLGELNNTDDGNNNLIAGATWLYAIFEGDINVIAMGHATNG